MDARSDSRMARPPLKFRVSTFCEVEWLEDEMKPNVFWLRIGPPSARAGYRIPSEIVPQLLDWISSNRALATMPHPIDEGGRLRRRQ